jgi:xyloglucan-specific exo-beta-1,4-glucanase
MIYGKLHALMLASCMLGCIKPPGTDAAASPGAVSHDTTADTGAGAPTSADGTPYVWKNVPILGGGFVTGVIFSGLEPNLVYARTDIGGAYRWEQTTRTWAPITDGTSREQANLLGIESLAIDPVDADKVYLAAGTYVQDWAPAGAILRSSDRGSTWQVTPMPFKIGGNEIGRSNGERLAVDPNRPNILYFGSRKNGLWKSEDGAATWQPVDTFPSVSGDNGIGIPIVAFPPNAGQEGKPSPVIYAAVSNPQRSLFVSLDAGATWKPIAEQPTGSLPSHLDFDAQGTLYVAYGNQPGPSDVTDGAIFKYSPAARKWEDITPLEPTEKDKFGYGGLSVDRRRAGHLVACSIDRWTMKDEIFRTTDGGKTWKRIGQSGTWHAEGALYLHHGKKEIGITHWTGDIDIDPFDSKRVTVVGGTGVFMTENLDAADRGEPVDYRFTNDGLEETAVLALASPPAGAHLLSGVGDICGFRHDDLDRPPARGAHQNPSCSGTTGLDFAEKQPNLVARVGRVWGAEPHGAFSSDGGASWTPFPKEPKGAERGGAIAISSDGQSLLWSLKGHTPAVSKDRGTSWASVIGVRDASALPDWTNMDLQPASDRENAKTLYLYDAHQGGFYVSRDGGTRFEKTYSGLPALGDWELSGASITAVPGFEGHVWLTTGRELYRSLDSGSSFEPVASVEKSQGLGVGKAAPGRSYPALYLIGTVGGTPGFFRSDDIGQTWVRINDEAHQFGFVNIVEGDPRHHGRVYLGSGGRGILYGVPKDHAE